MTANDTNVKLKRTETFYLKFKKFMQAERIIMNRKIQSCQDGDTDDTAAEIYWTNLAISIMYCQPADNNDFKNDVNENMKQIRKHSKYVQWNDICTKRCHDNNALNKNFLYEFYDLIDWMALLESKENLIDDEILDFIIEYELVSWDEISYFSCLSEDFIIKNQDFINWDIFLQLHRLDDIPIELRDMDNIINAIKENPDLINIRSNKSIVTETTSRLKRYSWIDRMPASETNYQDDTGNWIDTMEGTAEDESLISAVVQDNEDNIFDDDFDDIEL